MAIPVHLQGFKAAGIYRVVFDKSTILNQDTNILRLVVGYSEVGPFNTPVYVKSAGDFTALFGGISKKLEKRGIYFHRLALQMLSVGPILVLNLKKFDGEEVDGSTINTNFNPVFEPIETVKLNVEDIYDTSRFWTLDAEKLTELRAKDGTVLDQYINIATTNTTKTSGTYFIRKASGNKVSSYNLTIDSWYSDGVEPMPEYLEPFKQSKVSDFFAEIYVFKGKFSVEQVLASETLKNYFDVDVVDDVKELKLKPYVLDPYGEPLDTLDALAEDSTSGVIGHYIGSLIPYFKNKQGQYISLNVLFNNDIDYHNMMMSFNVDALEEGTHSIDLSGYRVLDEEKLNGILNGEYTTRLMGNDKAPVVAAKVNYQPNVVKGVVEEDGEYHIIPFNDFEAKSTKITGTLYVSNITEDDDSSASITLKQVGTDDSVTFSLTAPKKDKKEYPEGATEEEKAAIDAENAAIDAENAAAVANFMPSILKKFGISKDSNGNYVGDVYYTGEAFTYDSVNKKYGIYGPAKVITSISRVEDGATADDGVYTDKEIDFKLTFMNVEIGAISELTVKNNVYPESVSFLYDADWQWGTIKIDGTEYDALVCDNPALSSVLSAGDCLLAKDNTVKPEDADNYFDTVYVQNTGIDEEGYYYVRVSGEPMNFNGYFVRMDNPLNQEIGIMKPCYLQGYTYINDKPQGIDMLSKVNWQNFILSTLTDYKGLRVALLNKSEIDYRYVIDTFESYPTENLKNVLSYLCKEKQSAFCIANFPSVQSFVKCPYASFTDNKGLFNVQYVVDGCNKKKAASVRFSIPSDADGASFMAFYTPLKFSDGYIDTMVPSAGLVSNLFMDKYYSRQPYYIVAGPNFGRINAAGLVGPDYKYTMDELQIIEPFGVNCMVYRPSFGTFINANQTAKQIPLSALSKVNVRELVIYLQDEIEKVLQAYQWEFNNANTRAAILSRADNICANVQANGGLQAYLNIMDESNNGPEIIDNEMAVLSTHIEPGMGCGKMVHELTIYRTGQMASSIK